MVALRADEIQKIRDALGREPSTVELHAFDAQWSEHCSYKSSRHHLRKLPTEGTGVVVGVGEDAGIIHLGEHGGERYGIVVAHESHNHPSQVVPFEGAATGVGGIVRDVLCMGAEVIGIADALRFGNPVKNSHQEYVARTVVDGIAAYGNAIGVPTITGDVYFHPGFDDNCLVNVIALGVVKEREIIHSRAPEGSAGWDIVLVGKATDPSGFGGASFSSVTLDAADEDANKGAVQVPDPFLKNVIMRASYRVFAYLRERLAEMQRTGECVNGCVPEKITDIAGFKDLGAGGIMGCSAEICSAGNYGAEIDLDKVNVAVENLPPQVIAIGETQERLIWVLPPNITLDVLRIYNEEYTLPEIAYNARAVVIGKVCEEKRYTLSHRGEVVMDVDIDFLTGSIKDELPYDMEGLRSGYPVAEPLLAPPSELHSRSTASSFPPSMAPLVGPTFRNGIPTPQPLHVGINTCCREPLYRHYDAVVRGATVIPRGRADAGVFQAVRGSRLGVALSVAGDPYFGEYDPQRAAQRAVEEAIAGVIAVGAQPAGLTDCLNFGNPNRIEQYTQLVAAIEGLGDAARAFGLPFISGNVSLYNEAKNGNAIPASAIVACVGTIEDISRVITPSIKRAGVTILRIDCTPENAAKLLESMERGDIAACATIGTGGITATAERMLFATGKKYGLSLNGNLEDDTIGWLAVLQPGLTLGVLGEIVGTTLGEPVMKVGSELYHFDDLYKSWSAPLKELYV